MAWTTEAIYEYLRQGCLRAKKFGLPIEQTSFTTCAIGRSFPRDDDSGDEQFEAAKDTFRIDENQIWDIVAGFDETPTMRNNHEFYAIGEKLRKEFI